MADVTKDTRILTDAEFDDLLSRADAAIAEIDRATAKGGAYADALAGKEIGEGRAQSAEFNRGVETETAKSAGRAASATRGFEAKQSADRAKRAMDVSAKSSKASVALTKANVKKNRAQTAADLAQTDYSNAEHDAFLFVTDDLRERKFALTKRNAAASKSGSGSGGTASDVTTPENGSYNNNRGQITPPKSLADRDPLGLREQNGQTVTDKNGNKTWKQDETGLKHTANTKTSVSRIDDFADTVFRNMARTVDANGNYVYDLDYINENVKGSSIQRKCMNAYMTVQNTYTDILENGLSAAKRKDYIEAMKNVGVNEAYATGLVDDLGMYYAATLKKNMTAQAQLAKALGLEQSLDVRGYIATALDVGAYDTDFALGLIGQNDGDHIVCVDVYGTQKTSQKVGQNLPANLAVQKQNAGNGDYIETYNVEKKNINIDTATTGEIYAAAQRSANAAQKAFLLGVLADRVINKGESDNYGILKNHAAALRENEEKKERAKRREEERAEAAENAKKNRAEFKENLKKENGYTEAEAEQYLGFMENPDAAVAYIENIVKGQFGNFEVNNQELYDVITGKTDTAKTGKEFSLTETGSFAGFLVGDFTANTTEGRALNLALDAIGSADPQRVIEIYRSLLPGVSDALSAYKGIVDNLNLIIGPTDALWTDEEKAVSDKLNAAYQHYQTLYDTVLRKMDEAWVSCKLSLLGNGGELAQGLVDIYTDGISYWDTGEMTAAEAEKFDVEVLKDVLTRVYDKQGNDISRDTLDSVTQTKDGKPLSKFEQVKALLDFAMDKAAIYDEAFAQKYAEAYIKRYLPELSEETGGDVAYAIELLGDQIKAQKMQEAIRNGMNTDNRFVNALLDLGGLVLSVGTFFASAPAFLEATFSGGGDRPKNYYGTFGRVSLAGQQMRQEAIGDFSRHVSGNIGAALFGEDARATTEEWSNAILSGAMSVLDSYVSGKIFGGLAKIASANFGVSATVAMNFAKQMTLFTMSSGAGYSTMVQMHEKGYSDSEAVAYGWVSAFAEYISETINIDTVVSPEKLKGAKEHLWNMFEEGTEEVISNIVNDVYDLAIMQDSGEIAKEIEEYVSAGEDRGSAVRKVIGDHLYQSFQDFIGGAVGGGLGTAMGAAGEIRAKEQARTELGNAVRSRADLTEQAKGLSEEAGKKISAAEEKLETKKEKIKQKADKKGKTVSTAKIDSKTKLQSKTLTRTVGKYVQRNLEYEEAKKTVSDYAAKGEGISAKDITKNAELKSAVKKLAGKNPSAVKNTGVKGVVEKAAKKVIGETVTKKNAVAQFEKAKATEVSDVGKRAIKSVQNYLYDKENAAAVEYAKNVAKTFPNSFFAQKAQAVDIDYYTKEDASGLLSLTERVGEAYARVRKTDTKTATPTSGLLTDLTFLSGTDVTAENFSEMLEKVKKQGAKTDSLETLADAVERSAELIAELDEKDKRLIKRYRPDVREMLMEDEGDEDVVEGDGSHLIPLEKRIEAYEAFKSAAKAGIAEDVDLSRYEGRISQKLKAKAIADGAAELARDGRKGTSYALLDRADFDRKMKSRNFAAQVRLINALARKWGIHVTFTDMLGNGVYAEASNGLFVGNNQIVIDINSDYGMLTATFTHEGYHYLEKRNKAAAEELKKLVFDMLGEEGAKKARKEMRARGYAEDVIDSEIVADSLFDVLSEKGIIKEMSKETRVSVADMLRHLSDSIREMLSRLTGTETWRIELRDKATNYRHLSNMFMNAMDTAADDVQRAELVEDIRGEKRFSFKGYTKDGIEVYETSKEVKSLPWDQRRQQYIDLMKNQYQGKTAKFVRNGHSYYAQFDRNSIRKPIYGDKRSTAAGRDALVNAGADGDLFNLVENSRYKGSKVNTKKHTHADYFDYFIKTVQIDGAVFDLIADVEKKYGTGDEYIYTLALTENKKIKASAPSGEKIPVKVGRNALTVNNTISQNKGIVNTIISENSENDSTKRYSFKKTKSGMANDALLPYDAEMTGLIERGGNIIVDSYDKLVDAVNRAFENPNDKVTMYFGILDNDVLSAINKKIPNLPTEANGILFKPGRQYSVAATFDSIRHLVSDKSGLTIEDVIDYLDRFADTIVDSDTATFNYYIRGNLKINGILFKKSYQDGTILNFDLVSNKKKIVGLQTLYMKKADYKKRKSAETLLMQNASTHTSKTQVGQTFLTNDNTFSDKSQEVSFDKKQSKKKEPVKALKAEDVFGKDYKAEYAALKEETENIRKEIAALTAQEHIDSGYRQEQTKRLTQILENKEALLKRMDSLRTILAQLQARNANVSRYAKLFLDNFQAVKKTGSYRATGENWEIMKAVSEITDTYEPVVSDFATKAGLAKLQKEHKQIYDAFMAYARDKAYIRPFNLSEYKSVLEKLAKEYKAEGADISGLAAELKNAVEIYLNKAADKQPSYEALVREFDVILSDITEKSEKLADKSEWAQKIKGQTVKLVGDQYRNVIDTFGSLAEANRYMNGAVKFSRLKGITLTEALDGQRAEELLRHTDKEFRHGWEVVSEAEAKAEESNRAYGKAGKQSAYGAPEGKQSAYGGRTDVKAYSPQETKTETNNLTDEEQAQAERIKAETEAKEEILDFAKAVHELFSRKTSTEASAEKSVGREVFEKLLEIKKTDSYFNQFKAEMAEIKELSKNSEEAAAAYWKAERQISYDLGKNNAYARAFERETRKTERRNLAEFRDKLGRLLSQISKKLTAKDVTGSVKHELANLVRSFEVDDEIGYTQLSRVIDAVKKGAIEAQKEILDGDSMALYTKQIDSLAAKMDGRTLNSLNAPEMKEVYQLVRAIYKTLNDANKVYLDGRAAELKVVRDEVRREISELGRKKISNFGVILTANPMRFAEVLSNFDRESTIYKTFEDLEKAEYEATSRAFEYLMPFDKLNGSSKVLDKKTSNERLKQYKKFTSDYIDTPFEDADTGEKIQMSRSELLQLYMTWQREIHSDKIRHLQYMGFELGNRKQLKRGDFEKAFEPHYKNTVSLVTLEQMEKVRKILFDGSEAGKYAEEWFKTSQEFFRKAGQDLDRVYYERFFLHLDVDPYYIPMTVDTLEVQGKVPDTMREGETVMKYEQSGKLKEITPHAPQHIKIAGMHGLILNEAKSTANIVELMLPLKQFRTIWGTKLEEGNGRTSSVQKELAEKFTNGKGVRDYLVRLQNDLAGRPRETKVNNVVNNAFNTINGAFISSVLNTPSVIVKQVTALPVALHTVSYKNLGRFSPGGWYKRGITGLPYKVYIKAKRSALLDEYEQHGIYEFSDRLRGTFSVDMARMNEKTRGIIDWALRGNAVNRKLVGWYFNAMVAVDANTCLIIGEAVKRDVIDAGFKKGSAEYWTEVKKRVRKAINYTQQVGGVMHGTELQKTADGLLRTISRFTSQTTMTKSMVQFSFMEAVATRGKATHKEAVRNFGRTLVGFTAGQLAFRVLTELFSILHHKHYKYKDDDEKVTVKNLAKGILFGFVTDCVSTALILSPLTELFSAFVAKVVPNDDIKEAFKTYGVSDPILDVINDLADLMTNFSFKDFDAYDAKKVCRTIGSFTGIPAEALYSLIYGFVQYGQDISSGLFVSNWNMLWEKGYFYDIDFENASSGYSAYVGLVRDGETKAAEIFKKALEDFELNRGTKQDEIEDKFEKGVIKALTKDERIAEAYRAYTEGDSKKYAKILDGIKEFPQGLVDAAAESYIDTVESKIKTACESEDGNEIAAAKKYLEEKLHMTRDEIEFRIGKYVSTVKKSDLFAQIYDAWSKGQDYSELEKQAREKYGDTAYTSGFATELAKNKNIKEAYDAKQAGKLPQYDSILNGINVSENIRISAVEKYASMLDKNIATVFYDIDAAAVREARTVLRRDCRLTDSQIDELAAKYVPKEQSSEEQDKDRYKPADVVSCLKDGSNANAKFVIGKVREIYKGKGKTKDDADKDVRKKLTGEYKDEYRYAFATGNTRKQKAIISMLVSLDVGYDEETVRKWCLTKKGAHTAEYERWLEEDYAAYKATLR